MLLSKHDTGRRLTLSQARVLLWLEGMSWNYSLSLSLINLWT